MNGTSTTSGSSSSSSTAAAAASRDNSGTHVLSTFDNIDLYTFSTSPLSTPTPQTAVAANKSPKSAANAEVVSDADRVAAYRLMVPSLSSSSSPNAKTTATNETRLQKMLDRIISQLTPSNLYNCFDFAPPPPPQAKTTNDAITDDANNNNNSNNIKNEDVPSSREDEAEKRSPDEPEARVLDLFESIQHALAHIDFNLKRNSDFVNE